MRLLRRRSAPLSVQGPLPEVLEAEKIAAAAIASAKREADAWLDAERVAIGNAQDAELEALAERAAANEAAAQRDAIAAASAVVGAAETFSRDLRSLGDNDLLPIVARHVGSIIPGTPP